MWARGSAAAVECPRSLIRPESLYWLEQFHIWKHFGAPEAWERVEAKTVEALAVLDQEWAKEKHHGDR